MSWIDIRDDLTLWEYYPLLAESLDAEELERHDLVVATNLGFNIKPKKLKNWKWSTPDKAGTASIDPSDITKSMLGFALKLSGGNLSTSGSPEAYAAATGRVVAYRDEYGRLFDKDGNLVEKTDRTMVVNMKEVVH